MNIFRSLIVLTLVLGTWNFLGAQSDLQSLLEQKESIVHQISESKEKIDQFSDNISSIILKLSAIQRQIKLKDGLIKKRNQELNINNKILNVLNNQIDSIDNSLAHLQLDYKSKVNGLYLNTLKNYGKIKIPTQSTLKDIYAKQYRDVCQTQANQIELKQKELAVSKKSQELILVEIKETRNHLQKEKEKFDLENKTTKQSIAKLKSKKSALKKELNLYNKELKNLDQAISKVIRSSQNKEVDLELSGQFGTNKGLFRSPLSTGQIVSSFGEQPHPVITNVQIFNNGIDLLGGRSSEVSALYKGQVISIQEIPGAGLAIIIQHGEYYTVYSKLIKSSVHIGDQVSSNQHIGNISTLAGENILHIEIWKNQERLDPEAWINF